MANVPQLRPDVGLCCYDKDPDRWFADSRTARARQAAFICLSCPIIGSCAEQALRNGDNGVIRASVALPGSRETQRMEAKQRELRQVIEYSRRQSPEARNRALQIRHDMYLAAVRRHSRPRAPEKTRAHA